jgi:flagellar motor switch protein FliG
MSKPDIPFAKLFMHITPKDFIALFKQELPQTIAFILSFSPGRGYVKKVLRLLENRERAQRRLENGDDTVEKKISFTIQDYLRKRREESFDRVFVSDVEQEVNRMIAEYEDLSTQLIYR